MFTKGEYSTQQGAYGVYMTHTKIGTEAILVELGQVVSAYKIDTTGEYSFLNNKAKEMVQMVLNGVRGCTSKNGVPAPFPLGTITQHEFIKTKVEYAIQLFKGEVVGALIEADDRRLELEYTETDLIPKGINYVKLLTVSKDIELSDDDLDNVPVRSVEEIMLSKEDVTWLKGKKYYIVNDDNVAEQLFTYLDNYDGVIAYDTETTGLRINCFGKINSEYQKTLIKHNQEHPNEQIRADRLVGIIFCVEKDVSYYFPCFNRKFKNLYEDKNSEVRKRLVEQFKDKYTVGEYRDRTDDFADYWRITPADEITSDCILMERCRNILETKHIVAHNGGYEWKVGWQYNVDTNLKDDTMILHQIMYKFRSTTSNRGESSSLKYLAKVELGVDQWELDDFFPNFKEDDSGMTRAGGKGRKKKGSKIDFSYMDYNGTRIYAPTDGDVTFQLYLKYKRDMVDNHKEQMYIYDIEVIVACAVAYMEFYGHRLDEDKILGVRDQTRAKITMLESQIRQIINYSSPEEIEKYNQLKELQSLVKELEKANDRDKMIETNKLIADKEVELKDAISKNTEKQLNLASPAQVADLFYKKPEEGGLGYAFSGEKPSVAKKEIKALLKEKNPDGTPKNLVAHLYSEYKKEDTLMTKFFDNLPYYMYPGGFIFSSYGQISTATGRMSCSKPNAQQYPKAITKIVIPRDGYVMMDADYSQIEYRVLTAMAGNEWLAELFSDPDSDYHTLMASLMYNVPYSSVTPSMRSAAKSFNFGIPYGMGLGSLAILLTGQNNAKTRAEAEEKYHMYFSNQPKTKKFFEDVKEMAQINGYTRTLFDRYRYYSFVDKDGKVNNAKKAAALRQAGNAVIQGCLHGDTKIETLEHGIVPIKDVVGYRGKVWNGTKWTHGDVLYSGKKQKCIIRFWNGQKFICSPIHKFLKAGTNPNDINNYIECQDLKNGDLIEFNEQSELKIDMYNVIKELEKPNVVFIDNDEECINTSIVTKSKHGLEVESVEITDEYIDMYDVCNTDEGYYVADGIITHNTAADIFKISVARNFHYIRTNNLLGDFLIVNMVHDEQLMEVNVQKLNMQRILADVGNNMQFELKGFPPLYIGAGIGPAWGYAKGKMAEIHPTLLEQFMTEAANIPIRREDTSSEVDTKEILDYFANRVYEFRRKKVEDYLVDEKNWHTDIHPAIGGLINLQFNYGRGDEAKSYVGPNGETYSDSEFLQLNIADFIKENNLNVEASWFQSQEMQVDKEEDADYDEEDSDNEFDLEETDIESEFTVIDESDKLFGCGIHDIIAQFGVCVMKSKKVCGIDMRNIYYVNKELIIDYLAEHACDDDDPFGLEIVFLVDGNILNRTGTKVKGVKQIELEHRWKFKKGKGVKA